MYHCLLYHNGGTEQVNGREGETATFIWRCPLNFSLRVIGFAPRHLNRWLPRASEDNALLAES